MEVLDDHSVVEVEGGVGVGQPNLGLVSIVDEIIILGDDSGEEEEWGDGDVEVEQKQRVIIQETGDPNITTGGITCPECLKGDCSRPVQETCGHVKCRLCYIESDEGCKQCIKKTSALCFEDTDRKCNIEEVEDRKCNEEVTTQAEVVEEKREAKKADDGKRMQVRFQLEQPSGAKSIVIVSPETLRELGIEEFETDEEDVDDSESDNQNSAIHNVEESDGSIRLNVVVVENKDVRNGEENRDIDMNENEPEDYADQHDANINDSIENCNNVVENKDVRNSEVNIDLDVNEPKGDVDQQDADECNDDDVKPGCEVLYYFAESNLTNTDDTRVSTSTSTAALIPPTKSRKGKKRKNFKYVDHIIKLTPDVHNGVTGYKCLYCNKEFIREYHRQNHFYCNPANGKNPFICPHCSKICANVSHLDFHVRSQHTKEKPYACKICSHTFYQKAKLNRHMRSHENNSTPVKTPKVLTKMYLCAYCKKTFSELSKCKRHLLIHTEDRPFKCSVCTKTNGFKSKTALDSHMKSHIVDKKERPHKCSDCVLTFFTAKDLRRHALQHTGEYPYTCVICGQKTRRKDNFERHLRNTHQLSEDVRKMMSAEQIENYKKLQRE